MQASRRMALLAASFLWLAPIAALAADAGEEDAGTDGGTDTDTELCDGACAAEDYNACACGPDDPCGWAGDGVCDEACIELDYVDEMFDDSADCDPNMDGGTDTDTDADTDTDSDTSADSGADGSTGGSSTPACTCTAIGGVGSPSLVALLAQVF